MIISRPRAFAGSRRKGTEGGYAVVDRVYSILVVGGLDEAASEVRKGSIRFLHCRCDSVFLLVALKRP